MSTSPWDIYADQLAHLGYGHPLWIPDPAPGSSAIEIGDVGWINEGEFHALFNAFRSQDDAQPRGGVPVDHVPLDISDCTIVGPRDKISQSMLCSRSIRRVDVSGEITAALTLPSVSCDVNFRFICTDDAGALLFLDPSGRTQDLFSKQLIVDYIEAHFDRWVEFANHRLRLGLKEDQIVFISGTTKTSKWGVAAFRGTTREKQGIIVGNLGSLAAADFSMSIADAQLSTSHYRAGPTQRPASASPGASLHDQYDQCIFIHYYKRKRRKLPIFPSVIKAAAGPHELPRDPDGDHQKTCCASPAASDDSSSATFVQYLEPAPVKHTADYLLDYILENSSASVAIASDSDLSALCSRQSQEGPEFPSDIPKYLATIKPHIGLSINHVGSFSDVLWRGPDTSMGSSLEPAVRSGDCPWSHMDGSYLEDPSQCNSNIVARRRGTEAGDTNGCDRNKPRARQSTAKRVGACASCRRCKKKCTFTNPTDKACSRCTIGGVECHFPGRKPRSPGSRMVLQQHIRAKDAMIDDVLNQINPGPTIPTPLTLVPSRLRFSEEERIKHHDVLTYIERSTNQSAARVAGGYRPKYDISALENISEVDSDSDDGMDGVASPERGISRFNTESIFAATTPMGMIAIAAMESAAGASVIDFSRGSGFSHRFALDGGIANKSYFSSGPVADLELRRLIVERQAAPDILLSGLVTPDDAAALFQIHYRWINPIIPILDENIHTPAAVLARCPFLFTIVCTVASRYYDQKPHIYGMAIHFAKAATANAIIDGWKTVETTQAFALWSVYNPPVRRWGEDRAWCYTGIAFRLATELNLSSLPEQNLRDEWQEREFLNRTRMWLLCFIMDRCLSIQSGKAWMVQEDMTIRNASRWLKNYKYHNSCDAYLTSLTELLCIMSRFVGTANPAVAGTCSMEDVDFLALYELYDTELLTWKDFIDERHKDERTSADPAVVMQMTLIDSVYNHCRLVICCCGMQLMSRLSMKKPDILFAGCVQAATTVVKLMVEGFAATGFIRYLPEMIYVHAVFAAVVLMKCLKPQVNVFLDIQQEERIVGLLMQLCDSWASDKPTEEKHNMQIYASFLKQLVDPHRVRLAEKQTRAAQTGAQVSSSSSILGGQVDPGRTLGSLYADMDVHKSAAELTATSIRPDAAGYSASEQLFPSGKCSIPGLPEMDGTWGDGLLQGDVALAALMGLENEAWFPEG